MSLEEDYLQEINSTLDSLYRKVNEATDSVDRCADWLQEIHTQLRLQFSVIEEIKDRR